MITRDQLVQASAHLTIAEDAEAKTFDVEEELGPEGIAAGVSFSESFSSEELDELVKEVEAEIDRLARTHVEMARAILLDGVVR